MGYINGKLEYAGKQYDIPYTRNDLAPVVQKLDSAIQRISIRETNCIIHWIEIYQVDGAIQL